MKLNPIQMRSKMLHGNPHHTFQEAEKAIKDANEKGNGYYTVRTLQQSYPSHLGAIRHHVKQYANCTDCALGKCALVNNRVFFRGYIPADILFIGKSPDQNEDVHARPLLGKEGTCLDEIIIDVSKRLSSPDDPSKGLDNCFRWCVTNAVCCTPWDQGTLRSPKAEEIKACSLRLLHFICIVRPAIIITLGLEADKAIKILAPQGSFATDFSWSPDEEANKGEPFQPIIFNTVHPSWILKQASKKEQELQKKKVVLNVLGLLKPLYQE